MTRFIPAILILLISFGAYSKPINEITARKAAQNFLITYNNHSLKNSQSLTLAYTSVSDGSGTSKTYFYVYNIGSGFIIISADDQVIPVLGYSFEADFDPAKMPHDFSKWLDNYKNQIDAVITNNIQATYEIKHPGMTCWIHSHNQPYNKVALVLLL